MKHPRSLEFKQNRFLSHSHISDDDQCWNWLGATGKGGYGQATLDGIRHSAHRTAYILFVGPIPDNMDVCHKCDNRLCVNPKHLWLGTHKQNMIDMSEKDRVLCGSQHHFHKLTEDKVLAILKRLQENVTQKQIAKEFDTSEMTVSRIKRGIWWKRGGIDGNNNTFNGSTLKFDETARRKRIVPGQGKRGSASLFRQSAAYAR